MTARLTPLAFTCALALAAPAAADIYRCVSPAGDTSYSDSPCPGSAAISANVTELIGTCSTAECEVQREQARVAALARVEEEKALVQQMQEHRLKVEALDLDRRMQAETLQRLEALDAAQREMSSGVYYPAYPLSPGYGVGPGYGFGHGHGLGFGFNRPGCKGVHCGVFPGARPFGRHSGFKRFQRPVSKFDPN
jgi:hypothetical protein